jgi:hypothetical protein
MKTFQKRKKSYFWKWPENIETDFDFWNSLFQIVLKFGLFLLSSDLSVYNLLIIANVYQKVDPRIILMVFANDFDDRSLWLTGSLCSKSRDPQRKKI